MEVKVMNAEEVDISVGDYVVGLSEDEVVRLGDDQRVYFVGKIKQLIEVIGANGNSVEVVGDEGSSSGC